MRVGDFDLDERVLVVAEIGNNHEGDAAVARQLVNEAAGVGAHAVKLQTFRVEHYASAREDRRRFDQLSSYQLSYEETAELAELARSLGLLFISTPLDLGSADFLADVVDAYKIASGDLNFYPLIERVAATEKPLILSSGLSDLARIERALTTVESARGAGYLESLAVLHCVSAYPAPPEDLNLLAIPHMRERFGCTVGYSDHYVGTEAAVAAVALGARIVEKHFTLEGVVSDFRDHALSATPATLAALVEGIAAVERMPGKADKNIRSSEAANAPVLQRSIVAGLDLGAGHRLGIDDLAWVRPGGGLAPGEEDQLLGKQLKEAKGLGERLSAADVD